VTAGRDSIDLRERQLELSARPAKEFVGEAYRLILRRDPDEAGWNEFTRALTNGALSRPGVLSAILASEEFALLSRLEDAIAEATRVRLEGGRLRGLPTPPVGSERLIEIPWVLSRYRGEARVLDVGYAFAPHSYLLALTELGARRLVGVDLNKAHVAGIEAVVADVRALPFEDEAFDVVFCVSVLEHIGRDNRVYGLADELDEEGPLAALGELRRVLARRGRLLLTVACGPSQDFGWFIQEPRETWHRWFSLADLTAAEEEEYPASSVLCAELRRSSKRHGLWRGISRLMPVGFPTDKE
jgi:SAM-dependent methyltransferase